MTRSRECEFFCCLCGATGDYDFGAYVETEDCPYYRYACPECQKLDGVATASESVQASLRRTYREDEDSEVAPEIECYAGDVLNMLAENGFICFDEHGQVTPDSPMTLDDMRELEERLLNLKRLPKNEPPDPLDYDMFP